MTKDGMSVDVAIVRINLLDKPTPPTFDDIGWALVRSSLASVMADYQRLRDFERTCQDDGK